MTIKYKTTRKQICKICSKVDDIVHFYKMSKNLRSFGILALNSNLDSIHIESPSTW